eukprot:UN08431
MQPPELGRVRLVKPRVLTFSGDDTTVPISESFFSPLILTGFGVEVVANVDNSIGEALR